MTRFIEEHRQTYGVGSICKILPIAPSGGIEELFVDALV